MAHEAATRHAHAVALGLSPERLPVFYPSTASVERMIRHESAEALALCRLCGVPVPATSSERPRYERPHLVD